MEQVSEVIEQFLQIFLEYLPLIGFVLLVLVISLLISFRTSGAEGD
jgi:hypothetical protein